MACFEENFNEEEDFIMVIRQEIYHKVKNELKAIIAMRNLISFLKDFIVVKSLCELPDGLNNTLGT